MISRQRKPDRLRALGLCLFLAALLPVQAREYTIKQIADKDVLNREPVISETGIIAWYAYEKGQDTSSARIYVYKDGVAEKLSKGPRDFGAHPHIQSNTIVWIGSLGKEVDAPAAPPPAATNDAGAEAQGVGGGAAMLTGQKIYKEMWGVCKWSGSAVVPVSFDLDENLSVHSRLADLAASGAADTNQTTAPAIPQMARGGILDEASPVCWGNVVTWQAACLWPCGWEIMWTTDDKELRQITTNCYYDMGPQIFGKRIVWYGWDGNDFEIMMHQLDTGQTTQITDNTYDDISPVIWGDLVAWEAYPSVDGEIFVWQDGQVKKISDNPEDDIHPRIWDKYVVWQGLQGDNYEIFVYNGVETRPLTDTDYDNVDPDIRDGLICWVGHEGNWDAEIFIQGVDEGTPTMLTDNDYEDHHPRTAGDRIVWEAKREGFPLIYVAEPR